MRTRSKLARTSNLKTLCIMSTRRCLHWSLQLERDIWPQIPSPFRLRCPLDPRHNKAREAANYQNCNKYINKIARVYPKCRVSTSHRDLRQWRSSRLGLLKRNNKSVPSITALPPMISHHHKGSCGLLSSLKSNNHFCRNRSMNGSTSKGRAEPIFPCRSLKTSLPLSWMLREVLTPCNCSSKEFNISHCRLRFNRVRALIGWIHMMSCHCWRILLKIRGHLFQVIKHH